MSEQEVVDRYKAVTQFNPEYPNWCYQTVSMYKSEDSRWSTPKRDLTDEDFKRMLLRQDIWLGSRGSPDGTTDRISFDLDCSSEEEWPTVKERYFELREVIGEERVPLVYHTPSGCGLRVSYRIPPTPMDELMLGKPPFGLVEQALMASGLPLEPGKLEVLPRSNQSDRLPLGRSMPLLDPLTLEPLRIRPMANGNSAEALLDGLDILEKWHSTIHPKVVEDLRTIATAFREDFTSTNRNSDAIGEINLYSLTPPSKVKNLVDRGLTRRHSRNHAEFAVAKIFARWPEHFPEYGLGARPTKEEMAKALATWLSKRHNGYSEEWNRSLSRLRTVEAAVQHWTTRYLKPGADGSLIDRAVQAAANTSGQPFCSPTIDELDEVIELGTKHFPDGRERYQFECWTLQLISACKHILYYHRRQGTPRPLHEVDSGDLFVDVEIKSGWMRKWPYSDSRVDLGNGRTIRRHQKFMKVLNDAGWMYLSQWEDTPWQRGIPNPDGAPAVARRFLVRAPKMTHSFETVWIPPQELKPRIEDIVANHLRPLELAEAYHAIHVTERGLALKDRYGRRTKERIERYIQKLGWEDVRGSYQPGSTSYKFTVSREQKHAV